MYKFVLLAAVFAIFADVNSNGNISYGKDTINNLDVNGMVKLDGTKITDSLKVNGYLQASKAQIEKMQINGNAILNKCSVNQKSVVRGFLQAKNSSFSDEISIYSENAVFDSCSIKSIFIHDTKSYGKQILELKGKTKVTGTITFEKGEGEVIVGPSCEIGDVIGAKIKSAR